MFLKDIVIDIKSVTDNQVKKYFLILKKCIPSLMRMCLKANWSDWWEQISYQRKDL